MVAGQSVLVGISLVSDASIHEPGNGFLMAERPTELELSLDAIDDAYKGMIVQFTKDKAEGVQIDIVAGVRKAIAGRKAMIAMVTASTMS